MAQVDRFFENRPIEQKCGSCRWKDLLVACRILNRSHLSQVNQDLILKNVTLTEKKGIVASTRSQRRTKTVVTQRDVLCDSSWSVNHGNGRL